MLIPALEAFEIARRNLMDNEIRVVASAIDRAVTEGDMNVHVPSQFPIRKTTQDALIANGYTVSIYCKDEHGYIYDISWSSWGKAGLAEVTRG